MTPAEFRRTWVRRAAQLAAGLAVAAVAVAIAVHTGPARRAVLTQAVSYLERAYGIRLTASDLRYNLLTFDIGLSEVRVASTLTPDVPFLEADRLDVRLPPSVVRGPLAIDSLVAGRLLVRLVRSADGRTNLPSAGGGVGGDPAPLPVDRVRVARLDVEITDTPASFSLQLAGGSLDLAGGRGQAALGQGTIGWRRTSTRIERAEGTVGFDGRTMRLEGFRAIADDGTIDASGTVGVLLREPQVQLTVAGEGELPRLARWGTTAVVPAGRVAAEGTIAGPFDALRTSLRVRSDVLTWQGLRASAIDGNLTVDAERLQVSRLASEIAGGRLQLRGESSFASGDTTLDASWDRLDVGVLTRALAPSARVQPAGRTSGTAVIGGRGSDAADWMLTARTILDAGATTRDRLGVGGTVELVLDDGAWRLTADGAAGALPVAARAGGRLNTSAPGASTIAGTLTSADADLQALVQTLVELGVVEAPAEPIAGRAHAVVDVSGTLAEPFLQAMGDVADLRAAGIAGVAADFTARGTMRDASITVDARHGAGNVVHLRGTVRPVDSRVDARIDGRLPDLPGLGLAPASGTVEFELDAAGPFDDVGVRGTVRASSAGYDWFTAGAVDGTVTLDARTVTLEASADELSSQLRATYDRARRRVQVQLNATDADLARFVPPDAPVPVSGRVTLGAAIEGPLDRWEDGSARVDLAALSALVSNVPVDLAFPARADYLDGVVTLGESAARVGELRLFLAGRIPLRAGTPPVPDVQALVAEVDGDVAGLLTTLGASGLTVEDVTATGPVALRARIGGSLEQIAAVANIEAGPGTVRAADLPAISGLQLRAQVDGERLVVTEASGEWQGSHLVADASVPLGLLAPYLPAGVAAALPRAAGPARLTLRTDAVTPRVLEPFVGADVTQQLGGSVALSAALEAGALDLASLRGEVQLDRLDLTVAGLPVTQREPTRIVAGDGVARVAAWQWEGPDSVLRVGGQVGLADRQAALLAGGRFDLRLLAPLLAGTGVAATGVLEPRISVAGRIDQPLVEGELVLTGGELRLDEPQVIATDLGAFAVLAPDGLMVTRLTGRVNGGTLSASGRLPYGTGPAAADDSALRATVTGMALEFPTGLRSELDAELSLTATGLDAADGPRGRLSGTVTVARGSYREPISVVTELLAAVRPERRALITGNRPSALDRLALDLRILTDDDVVVRNNIAQLQLGADLRLIGTAAVPALSGRATLREGGLLALGNNRYTIDQGTIDFSNPALIEPRLNVQARTRAGGEDIELTLTGTPATLDVSLTSPSDPLLGEADIASLLLTGRRLEEVQGAEAQIVGEQVLGYLSGDLLGAASRAIGFDSLRLGGVDDELSRNSSTIATQTDPTSRMTFVKSFDPFEVTLSQGLRNAAQTWVVDYTPRRRLVLRLVSRDDTLRSYEIRHDVLVGAAPSTPRPERASADTRRVAAVTLEGDLAIPEPELRRELRLDDGDAFDAGTWQEDRDRLEAALRRAGHLEARVSVSMSEGDGGVSLAYRIVSGPRTTLMIEGQGLPAAVQDELRRAWAVSIADATLRTEAAAVVARALARRGYLQAEIGVAVDRAAGENGREEKTLRITVTPGPRSGRRLVRLEPADLELTQEITRTIGAAQLVELADASPALLADVLTAALRERGYVQGTARVAGPAFDGATATWTATLNPGAMFVVGTVALDGGGDDGPSALRDLQQRGFAPGTVFTPAALDAAVAGLVQDYRRRGYTRAVATPRLELQPEGRANVVFAVEAGRQQVLQRVDVDGNRAVRADEIVRALALDVGAPLGSDAWLEARTRVFETGLFSRVDVSTEEVASEASAETVPVAVRVVVQEWPAVRLRYGFQLSEEWIGFDPLNGRNLTPGLSADATRRSLFGRAVTVGAAAIYRSREQQARVFASAPRLWGRRVESLISIQQSSTEITGETVLNRDVAGVSWEQRTHLAERLELSYSYRFERNHTFDPNPPDDPLFPTLDITANVARLVGTAAFDSRDDLFDARRGLFVSSSVEYAPEALGSTSGITFLKSLSQLYYFRPWRGLVLASAARFGVSRGLGGGSLIPTERFRAGGARTVRGVEEESLGPRDPIFGDVIGGDAVLIFNQEARFPIFRWLRGTVFLDAGNVFARPRDLALGDLTGSSGAGLRLATPFGLLRVDYGRLWSPTDRQRGGRWSFGIGQVF